MGFKILPDVLLYASYSESFQPQAFGLFTNDVPSGSAKPIVGKGTEVGIKTDLMNGRISTTIALFDITETNLVQTLNGTFDPVTGVATTTTVQIGEAESHGATVEITYSPTNNFQIYASATFDNAFLSKNPQDPTQVGDPLQYSTRRLASLWARYNFTGALKGFYVAGGPNYTGPKSFAGPGNPLMILGLHAVERTRRLRWRLAEDEVLDQAELGQHLQRILRQQQLRPRSSRPCDRVAYAPFLSGTPWSRAALAVGKPGLAFVPVVPISSSRSAIK